VADSLYRDDDYRGRTIDLPGCNALVAINGCAMFPIQQSFCPEILCSALTL
jgi:hypothetical protein